MCVQYRRDDTLRYYWRATRTWPAHLYCFEFRTLPRLIVGCLITPTLLNGLSSSLSVRHWAEADVLSFQTGATTFCRRIINNQMQLRRLINGVIDDGDIWRRRDKYLPIENSWVNHWRMLCGDCSMCINFAIMNSYLFRPKFFACSRKIHRERQEFPLQVGARNPVQLVLFDASVETPKL